MWPTALDMHTLDVEHAALLGAFTVLTTLNALLYRGERGARWFPVYTFAAFLGAILIALRDGAPNTPSLTLGAVLFPVAYVFLHLALMEFFGRGARACNLQLLFVAASAAGLDHHLCAAPHSACRGPCPLGRLDDGRRARAAFTQQRCAHGSVRALRWVGK